MKKYSTLLKTKLEYDEDIVVSKNNIIKNLTGLSEKINIDNSEEIPDYVKLPKYIFKIVNSIATIISK